MTRKKDNNALLAAALEGGDLERFVQLRKWILEEERTPHIEREDRTITVMNEDLSPFPLQGIGMRHVTFINCSFGDGSLEGAEFSHCLFQNCTFNGTRVREMTTTNTDFEKCSFTEVDFEHADFCGGTFYGPCVFTRCRFSGIKAKGAGWQQVVVDTVQAQRCLQRHIVMGVQLPRKRRNKK